MDSILSERVKIPIHHRALKAVSLERIKQSIQAHGYNVAYPIVIDRDDNLVDGRHRLVAAQALGLTEVPYLVKPDGVSSIRFGLQCNADGQLCEADDVFDLAELCWGLAQEGWTGEQIAAELGWNTKQQVEQYASIKAGLHPSAWVLARYPSTRNANSVDSGDEGLVDTESTIVDWKESHFRAFLKRLTWTEGDRAVMRAQLKAIKACLARATEKDKRFGATQKMLTASWIAALAAQHAWYVKLAKHMRDNLVQRVPIRDRIDLLSSVYGAVYGDKDDDPNLEKFDRAIKRLNEKALGVILYHEDMFQRIPLLQDGSVALVITDPPYNVTDQDWDRIGTDDEYIEFTHRWLDAVQPKLAADYHLFFFCDPDYAARIEAEVLMPGGWPLLSRVIWWNRSLPSGRCAQERFVSTWQMVFHCGTHTLNWEPKWSDARFDVQDYAAPNANTSDGGYHPTPKPQKFIEYLVMLGSKPTDIVLDPFAGGGTTGAACVSVRQRACVLVEQADEFCTNIEKRLKIRREE
jgi:site-specific DNA-methyltransferase (adenine-specific)